MCTMQIRDHIDRLRGRRAIVRCALIAAIGLTALSAAATTTEPHIIPAATSTDTTETVATSSVATTTPTQVVNEAEQIQAEQLEVVDSTRAELREPDTDAPLLTDRSRTRIRNLAANMSNRTEAAIDRLDRIADRLERRADKLDRAGAATRPGRTAIAAARTHLATASHAIATIDEDVHRVIYARDPSAAWREVDLIYTTAHDAIRHAHGALRISVSELSHAASPQE